MLRQVVTERKLKDIYRPVGTPRIVEVPTPRLREMMAQRASWFKWIKDGVEKGEAKVKRVAAHPPEWAYLGVEARGEWPVDCVRPLSGIIEAPSMRPDWSFLDTPGWDPETGLLYLPNADFLPLPGSPTRDDARAAAKLLLALVRDFPFVDQTHRVVWLAALLTMLVRSAIEGPTPIFLFDANVPGIGKTKLCDLISIIVTGRDISKSGYPKDEVEMAKAMLAVALGGDLSVMFDNVKSGTSIGGETVDRVSTATTLKGRILGKSESIEVPWVAVMLITGNNLGVTGDGMRRIVYSAMSSTEERPEERSPSTFSIPGNILTHARRDRARYVQAGLTILKAFHAAGRPDPDLTATDYTAWCEVVRNAVYWSTDHDPCATRKELRESDPESAARVGIVEGWSQLPDAERGLTIVQALKHVKENPAKLATLHNVLMGWGKGDELPSSVVVGNRLKPIKGRVINGKVLNSVPYQGTQMWSVAQVRSRGAGGAGGAGSIPRGEIQGAEDMEQRNPQITSRDAVPPHEPHQPHGAGLDVFDLKATGRPGQPAVAEDIVEVSL